MNKVEELIKEFCPSGVEYKELDTLVYSIKTGLNPRQNFKLNTPGASNYYVTVKEITSGKILFSNKTDKIDDEALSIISNRSRLEFEDVLFSGIGTIGKVAIVDIPINNWNVSESVFVIKSKQDLIIPKFLMHILSDESIKDQYKTQSVGSTLKGIRMSSLLKLKLPVPALPVQREIVNILDKFKSLEAELEAELEARKEQYEYYRNQLFSFDGRTAQWKALGEIGEFVRGKRFVKDDFASEGVPCLHYGEMYTHYHISTNKSKSFLKSDLAAKLRVAHPGDVIIVAAGETIEDIGLGVAWLGESDIVIHDACFAFTHSLNPKYISHYLQTDLFHSQIKRYISSGKISSINASGLRKAVIPIPTLAEQERIVRILDKFDTLVNDISEGLPAEIEARRKQYEYYRGKLLDFKPLTN